MTTALVSGALANKPLNGGEAWVRLSWVRGLRQLGVEARFVEQIAESTCTDARGRPVPFEDSINRAYFERVTSDLAPGVTCALVCEDTRATAGLDFAELADWACAADLLINISGHLTLEPLRSGPSRSAYIDVDPGFTQIWSSGARLKGHDRYFTVGENVGSRSCTIPAAGIDWRPLPPPVTLDDWPLSTPPAADRFTTVSTWRSPLGALRHDGVTFPGKHHQWRRMLDLPRRSPHTFEIALDIDPADASDREALLQHGWRLTDPHRDAADPLAFRSYVQGSTAEFSVAHGVYVDTASGWVSDRTVRYLACGRPALVQDTGLAVRHPVGDGLVTFRDLPGAVAGAERIIRDYEHHATAARELACGRFDARTVLAGFLEQTVGG